MDLAMLIIDDHPTMLEGYKSILNTSNYNIKFTTAYDCERAYEILTSSTSFDVILLDINLPPFEEQQVFSGEDLAFIIQQKFPECKIIILTSYVDYFTLYNIVKKTKPDGLLVKSDFTAQEFTIAFEHIINGKTYYSTTVEKSIKELVKKEIYLDATNRRIISLLSKGIKTKNLPNHINLSISAIDKRKVLIKEFLNIDKGSDEDIIRAARKQGYI